MEPNVLVKINALDNSKAAFASLKANLGKVESTVTSAKQRIQDLQPAFQKMALIGTAAFAGIVGVAAKSIQAYAEVERAQRQLEHAIVAVSGGTQEQVARVNELTAALEKKAGVDSDSLTMGVAQLSTFGLSSEAVIGLTKSLADLTVNQSGLNATSQDYIQSANNIAKALNGQFGILEKSGIRFTEAQQNLILYGTETQKVAAMQAGFAQNLRETTDTVGGADLAMAKARRTMENINENLGKALIPAFAQLTTTIQPIIEKIANWTEKNPVLTKTILITAAAVAALAVAIGVAGIAMSVLMTPVTLIIAGVVAVAAAVFFVHKRWDSFGLGLKLILLPIKIVIEGFKLLYSTAMWLASGVAWAANKIGINLGNASASASGQIAGLQSAMAEFGTPLPAQTKAVEGLGGAIGGVGTKASEAAEKLKRLKEEAAGIYNTVAEDQSSSNKQLAEAIVEQEKGIADKKSELRRLQRAEDTDSNASRIRELKTAISEEQSALSGSRDIKRQISVEIDEAERRQRMSAFERKIEDIQKERIARLEAQILRLQEIQTEVAAERQKSGAIAGAFNAAQSSMQAAISKTREVAETEGERIRKAFDRAASSMAQLGGGKGGGRLGSSVSNILQGRAKGGPVTGGTPYIVGEVGPEVFVPSGNGSIVPNNALRPAMAGAGAGASNIYLTITGNSFMGERDMAEKLGDMIIRKLKNNSRL